MVTHFGQHNILDLWYWAVVNGQYVVQIYTHMNDGWTGQICMLGGIHKRDAHR